MNSFLENFSGKDKEVPKLALYRLWLGKSVDEMKPLTKSGGDGIWGQLGDSYFLAEGMERRLDAVFRGLEKKYGKRIFAHEGQKLEPITATTIPADVVKALKNLPRAEALQLRLDEPRDDGTFSIRSVCSRKGFVIGRAGKVFQLTLSKSRVVWKLNQVGDHYQIINTANGLVLDGSGDQPTARRSNRAAAQLWSFVKAGDAYHIKCKGTGRVLDLSGGAIEDGTPIVMWDLKEPPSTNQLWMLTKVSN